MHEQYGAADHESGQRRNPHAAQHQRPLPLQPRGGIRCCLPFKEMPLRHETNERSAYGVDHDSRLMRKKRAVKENLMQARRKIVALRSQMVSQPNTTDAVGERLAPLDVRRKEENQKRGSGP